MLRHSVLCRGTSVYYLARTLPSGQEGTGMSSVGKLDGESCKELLDHPGGGRAQGEPDRNSHSVLLEPSERPTCAMIPNSSVSSLLFAWFPLPGQSSSPPDSILILCKWGSHFVPHLSAWNYFSERLPQATPPKLVKGFMPFSYLTDIREHVLVIVYLSVSVHPGSSTTPGHRPFLSLLT